MSNEVEIVHVPVLLQFAIHYLNIDPAGVYVDCTLGDGGYSKAIFDKLTVGKLISFDFDDISVSFVKKRYENEIASGRWLVRRENFSKLDEELRKAGIGDVDGIVFDLGLSSRQLDADPNERGFSYRRAQKLDMRMDSRLGVTALDLMKVLSVDELERLIREYGEERYAKRIAIELKKCIAAEPERYQTSDAIAALVRRVVPAGYLKGSKHPARRVFQAFRIAVNDELRSLQLGLSSALSVVGREGRIVVVSYHSLEDRVVKNAFAEAVKNGGFRLIESDPILPTREEIEKNSRSASAKMRVVERVKIRNYENQK